MIIYATCGAIAVIVSPTYMTIGDLFDDTVEGIGSGPGPSCLGGPIVPFQLV